MVEDLPQAAWTSWTVSVSQTSLPLQDVSQNKAYFAKILARNAITSCCIWYVQHNYHHLTVWGFFSIVFYISFSISNFNCRYVSVLVKSKIFYRFMRFLVHCSYSYYKCKTNASTKNRAWWLITAAWIKVAFFPLKNTGFPRLSDANEVEFKAHF